MQVTKALPVAAFMAITACAGTEINKPPVRYTATKALHESGTSSFSVYTYTKKSGGGRSNVTGVPCVFEGDGFSSAFTSPAVVISPNMRGRTPVASVTCTLNGVKRTQVIQPFNETVASINNGATAGAAGGLIGLIVGGAVAVAQSASRDVTQDVYGYPDVSITFGR